MKGASVESKIDAEHEGPDLAQEHFVDVAPGPIFTWLKRSNDRMTGGVKMLRGMAIRRRVAATYMSARQAKS
jgi:hypothetical protein